MGKAVVITGERIGNPHDLLELYQKEKPAAKPGHVVIHMTLRPVNPTDLLVIVFGSFKNRAIESPVLGSEGVGIVEEVGEGVSKFKVGQRVVPYFITQFYSRGQGSWQEYIEIPADEVFAIPETLSDEVAAQFIINPWTVYWLLKDQDIPKGEYLLQTAAASVFGRQVIQLAKHWGFKTINIVRRDEQIEELKSLGADEVINSAKEDVAGRVKEITGGKGAYGAIDAVAGPEFKDLVQNVRAGGKIFVYGVLGGNSVTINVRDLNTANVKFKTLFEYLTSPEKIQETADAVLELLEQKVLTPIAGSKFYVLDEFLEAIVESEKPARGGKVFLKN